MNRLIENKILCFIQFIVENAIKTSFINLELSRTKKKCEITKITNKNINKIIVNNIYKYIYS